MEPAPHPRWRRGLRPATAAPHRERRGRGAHRGDGRAEHPEHHEWSRKVNSGLTWSTGPLWAPEACEDGRADLLRSSHRNRRRPGRGARCQGTLSGTTRISTTRRSWGSRPATTDDAESGLSSQDRRAIENPPRAAAYRAQGTEPRGPVPADSRPPPAVIPRARSSSTTHGFAARRLVRDGDGFPARSGLAQRHVRGQDRSTRPVSTPARTQIGKYRPRTTRSRIPTRCRPARAGRARPSHGWSIGQCRSCATSPDLAHSKPHYLESEG